MGVPKERKDTAEKEFLSFPDVTADVINVLLYGGKRTAEQPGSASSAAQEGAAPGALGLY